MAQEEGSRVPGEGTLGGCSGSGGVTNACGDERSAH